MSSNFLQDLICSRIGIENGTGLSTFEDDLGVWTITPSNNVKWERQNRIEDHTRVSHETLLFSENGTSIDLGKWYNISVDVNGIGPFKIILEAAFYNNKSKTVEAISVDDTSIAYRPCKGEQIDTTCQDISKPVRIECETQFLVGDIKLSLEPVYKTDCQEETIETDLNYVCRNNFKKSEQCYYSVFERRNKSEDCYECMKNISVKYLCIGITEETEKTSIGSSTTYDSIGLAAGVSGGVLLTIIAIIVILSLRGSNSCDCVAKNITSFRRYGQESRITETGVYECSNISSRLSDHAYDSFECANYYNMKNVPNSS
ncbi:uncharacterized protein LOC134726477 [Mytilus trossulus]|uniref:uncharacterized protein LOC134726477 n=1 Tax=Mytilus trossulus TaxID=6551 RepID=UPI003006F328